MARLFGWILLGLFLTNSAALPTTNKTRAVSDRCSSAGIFCLDCNTLGLCAEINGQFHEYTSQTCSGGIFCSQSLKACSGKMSYCFDDDKRKFLCQGEGIFPDPYDCNVYHQCNAPGSLDDEDYAPDVSYVCDVGTAFDLATLTCTLPDTHETCGLNGHPVPERCGVTLNGAAFEENPSYYWMCISSVIRVFKCDEGKIFDTAQMRCVSDGSVPEEPETTTAPICSGTGREPDPTNCYRYYDCSNPSSPVLSACPAGKYFHRRKNKCKLGFCIY